MCREKHRERANGRKIEKHSRSIHVIYYIETETETETYKLKEERTVNIVCCSTYMNTTIIVCL